MINVEIKKYLDRIQAADPYELSLNDLAHLQKQHILNVYFENLDILNQQSLSLDKENLYHKLIINERGGVCYELNGSFFYLLEEVGFKPYLMTGTVYTGSGEWALENSHMFLIVPVDGKEYLVDVGFGGNCPRLPVPLSGEEVRDYDGYYRIMYDKPQDLFCLQKKTEEEWEIQYRFDTPSPKWNFENIQPICVRTETSPESNFNKGYFFSRATEEGRITLIGNKLIILDHQEKTKKSLEEHEIAEAARHYFQIELAHKNN